MIHQLRNALRHIERQLVAGAAAAIVHIQLRASFEPRYEPASKLKAGKLQQLCSVELLVSTKHAETELTAMHMMYTDAAVEHLVGGSTLLRDSETAC